MPEAGLKIRDEKIEPVEPRYSIAPLAGAALRSVPARPLWKPSRLPAGIARP